MIRFFKMPRYKFCFCLAFAACASGGSMMSMNAFYDVPVGASQEEVIASIGKPVAIKRKEDGFVEYEYVERLTTGGRTVNETHYYIVIKDGIVVSKHIKQLYPRPYGFDSYEMQTTHNEDIPF